MPYCPMWKWYKYEDSVPDYPINSAITGSIKVTETGEVLVATDNLEKSGRHLQCAANAKVKTILALEAKGQKGEVRHYGLIIIQPGKDKLSAGSEVVDFISFHRDPKIKTDVPPHLPYDMSAYNKVFEEELGAQPVATAV